MAKRKKTAPMRVKKTTKRSAKLTRPKKSVRPAAPARPSRPTRTAVTKIRVDNAPVKGAGSTEVLGLVHELEELSAKVFNTESEVIRTKEMHEDLFGNLDIRTEEKEILIQKTEVITAERDKFAEEMSVLDKDIAKLGNEMAALIKSIENSEVVKKDFGKDKDLLDERTSTLASSISELKEKEKKLTVEAAKLTQSRKQLTS